MGSCGCVSFSLYFAAVGGGGAYVEFCLRATAHHHHSIDGICVSGVCSRPRRRSTVGVGVGVGCLSCLVQHNTCVGTFHDAFAGYNLVCFLPPAVAAVFDALLFHLPRSNR